MAARGVKRMREREAGQTLVETAIVLAIFLALGFGIVEFGRAWFFSNHLNNSVRAAARYGAVLGGSVPGAFPAISSIPAEQKIHDYAVREITTYIRVDSGDIGSLVTVGYEKGPGNSRADFIERNDTIKVSASLPFHLLSGDILGKYDDFTMTRSASMRFE